MTTSPHLPSQSSLATRVNSTTVSTCNVQVTLNPAHSLSYSRCGWYRQLNPAQHGF
jgi:hypothetical protein